jgi:hypothetical protein
VGFVGIAGVQRFEDVQVTSGLCEGVAAVVSGDRRLDAMTSERLAERSEFLEGSRVSVALVDGSRIDDCELVSVGHGAQSLWLHTNGADTFVAHMDVIDLWEVLPPRPGRAA